MLIVFCGLLRRLIYGTARAWSLRCERRSRLVRSAEEMQRGLYIEGRFAEKRVTFTTFMAYDEALEKRIRRFFDRKRIKQEGKRMIGGLCFMVKGKMCVGVEKSRLMARVGPGAYEDALTRKG